MPTFRQLLSIGLFTVLGSTIQAEVNSIPLSQSTKIDGLFFNNGQLYGAAGWDGTNIYHISDTGELEQVGDVPQGPIDIVTDTDGHLLVTSYGANAVYRLEPDSGEKTILASFPSFAGSIVPYGEKAYLVGSNGLIYHVDAKGNVSTFFEDAQKIDNPTGLTQDPDGFIYIGNLDKATILKLNPKTRQAVILAQLPRSGPYNIGKLVYHNGYLYASHLANHSLYQIDAHSGEVRLFSGRPGDKGSKDGVTAEARFNAPNGLALDAENGILWIAPAFRAAQSLRQVSLP